MSIVSFLVAAVLFLVSDTPDLITLKDGKEIECRVLFEDQDTVVYTTKRKAQEVARSEVASIQSIERSLREFLDRYDQMDDRSPTALLELADFCEARELHGEARHLRLRVLSVDPENTTAWTKLGGVHTDRRGWRLKVRGRFYTLEQLRERVGDWKNALEIPTAHFLIKSDYNPERILDIAIDIERAYLTFYDLIGNVLRLYPFDGKEIPEIFIYGTVDEYPAPPNPGDVAYFQPGANIMHVSMEDATAAPAAAVAELVDLLLWNFFRRTVGKTGNIAPWTRTGLGQAFGAAYRRDPGHASWDLTVPISQYFDLQAGAKKPLTAKQVIRAGWRSFDSGTDAQLYNAQSYTFIHFLAYADDGAYREGLGKYLISSFKGQNSTTHLEKALDMKMKDIDERYTAYVKMMAGR